MGRRQPVHADDLAKLVLAALDAAQLPTLDSPVCGGNVLTYRQMVEKIFFAFGLPPRIIPLPSRLLASLVRAIAWLPFMDGLNAGFILRQNHDLTFDDSRLRVQLGFEPRPFEPGPEDFDMPDYARELQPP